MRRTSAVEFYRWGDEWSAHLVRQGDHPDDPTNWLDAQLWIQIVRPGEVPSSRLNGLSFNLANEEHGRCADPFGWRPLDLGEILRQAPKLRGLLLDLGIGRRRMYPLPFVSPPLIRGWEEVHAPIWVDDETLRTIQEDAGFDREFRESHRNVAERDTWETDPANVIRGAFVSMPVDPELAHLLGEPLVWGWDSRKPSQAVLEWHEENAVRLL